ncbi:MAG: 16S rRNA (guanine(966)-N(2))-methyltransferase RsmD [Candidatus Dormiibacterota bacterium]
MAETRISGGTWRGRRILTPRGLEVRPTRAMVRQALFNILGPGITGARMVDLYAGAGSVGFEALSRGAARVTFVDVRPASLRLIAATAAILDCEDRIGLVPADALSWLRRRPPEVADADLCFVDAPYRDQRLDTALVLLGELAPALVVCEHHRDRPMPAELGPLRAVRTARYGLTGLTVYRRGEAETSE